MYSIGRSINKLFLGILVLFLGLTVVGCTPSTPNNTATKSLEKKINQHGKALQIVTTFPPLYGHTANIADENDVVTNLVPAGTSVHTRQPKPSDIQTMEQADIIITNGLGLEEFLDEYLENLEKQGVLIVDTSTGIETRMFGEDSDEHHEDEHHEDEHHEDEHGHHHHDGPDPHIWLDPNNAKQQAKTITKALYTLDPSQKTVYQNNAETYIQTLSQLDQTIKQTLSNQEIAPFIVFHDAYQYFLHAYAIDDAQVGLVQEFHGDNPSQKQIATLIKTIQEKGVKIIYTEPQFNPSVVQRLEQETGVISKEIDPIGALVAKDGYLIMMQNLAKAFSNKQ